MILEAVSPQVGKQLLELREGDNEVLALHQIVENGQICFLVYVIEEVCLHHVVGVGPNQLLALSLRLLDYLLNVQAAIIRLLGHYVLGLVIVFVRILFGALDFDLVL
jgi:hypothetical protein